MIVIVDYGMGNLGSIANMLKKVGHPSKISSSVDELGQATRLILPGVGAFDHGMASLRERGLVEVLTRKVVGEGTPVLGICLGMQLLTERSAEGRLPGLGWVAAETIRFELSPADANLRVPHMGWNVVATSRPHGLFRDMPPPAPRFYFVHSYYAVCRRPEEVVATADHGVTFCAAFAAGHIMGVQFHPEKSHQFGMRLLANFASGAAC